MCVLWHINNAFHEKEGLQTVKNLLAMQETWVQSLGWEDPLEEGMATHPSILAWRIPWTEEPSGPQSMGSERVRPDRATNTFTFSSHSFEWGDLLSLLYPLSLSSIQRPVLESSLETGKTLFPPSESFLNHL